MAKFKVFNLTNFVIKVIKRKEVNFVFELAIIFFVFIKFEHFEIFPSNFFFFLLITNFRKKIQKHFSLLKQSSQIRCKTFESRLLSILFGSENSRWIGFDVFLQLESFSRLKKISKSKLETEGEQKNLFCNCKHTENDKNYPNDCFSFCTPLIG